ncbi:DUF3519 domain-containing protein, partial [Helicobacter pylori]
NREPNENNPVLKRLIEAVKDMQKESEKGIKQKLETQWGPNYSEFKGDGLGAINKLLETKKGFVAGAFYKEGLGDIDLVWGTPKTKESNGYGLAHILEKREKQYKRLGLTNEQAKERTKELLKQIPEVIEKGIKDNDYIGHATIRHNGIEVGLSSQKGNTPLKNHYMITSFETDEKVLRELETIGTLSNNYRDGINYSTSNLNNPNPTTNTHKTQEPLSEQANAKKLLKLESEKGSKKQKFEAQWGPNYSEFKGDGLGAINKLLETKKGFVAGAFHKEGLGDIDLVWGNKDYGLEHILKRREDQALNNGINETEAKEYAMSVVKTIPEVIEKGVKVERNGRVAIEYQNIRVGLKDNWKGEKLPNHWVITGYEKRLENSESLYTSPLITKGETLPLNSNKPNPTTNALKTQEPLSEQANAKKLLKLESEKGIKKVSKKSTEEKDKEVKKRAFKVIEDKEAFLKDLNAIKPTPLPKAIDTESFLNAFNGVKNKENFIKHLKNKPDSTHRLAYLHLVEPTLKEPDITLIFKDQGKEVKKEHIKAFQGDPKTIYYFLVTQDNDSKLITGLKVKPIYIKAEIDKADIIHSFIPQARTLKE